MPDMLLQSANRETTPVTGDPLHGFDKNGEPGTVDVADPTQVNDHLRALSLDRSFKLLLHDRRAVKIKFSLW